MEIGATPEWEVRQDHFLNLDRRDREQDRNGTVRTANGAIAENIRNLLRRPLHSHNTMTAVDCDDFLKDIYLQGLSGEAQETLEADLTVAELTQTIHDLQSGKAVGPNGLLSKL
ncbi:hypothetical protein NDU88_007771 [Pleurodeles waltl]|uniref:Uncharacterized protein n=1 Tax=Pleurodeles waltl TaxID=8319 RepID=A0AAV7STS7_PLEWA|nr:hypothetical protein NDU88_007771 [Pleurodeles waltl]